MLKIENLNIRYGDQEILKNISADFCPSKVHILLGRSGIGKTSLLNTALLDYKNADGQIQRKFQTCSMVFQEDRLLPYANIYRNIELVLKTSKANKMEKIHQALRFVNLEGQADKMPYQLSGGMRQRVNIARALAHDGDLIVMDEAFKSIDYNNKWHIVEELKRYFHARQKTVIVVTHDIEVALALGDFIHVLRSDHIHVLQNDVGISKLDLITIYD